MPWGPFPESPDGDTGSFDHNIADNKKVTVIKNTHIYASTERQKNKGVNFLRNCGAVLIGKWNTEIWIINWVEEGKWKLTFRVLAHLRANQGIVGRVLLTSRAVDMQYCWKHGNVKNKNKLAFIDTVSFECRFGRWILNFYPKCARLSFVVLM